MKKTTTLLLYTLALSACNLGTPTSNDVQSANNSTKQFSLALVAIGCKTISANGGSCNLAITHSAAASKYLNQAIVISLPNLYKISANNCKSTQAKSSSCSVTISSNAEIYKPIAAKLMINDHTETAINFTLGKSN